jgi:hypothetical protein
MTAPPSNPRIPLASSGGLQFSVWDLGCFLVACAAYFGWLRFVFTQVDSGRIPAFEHPVFLVALLYWPMPLAVLGLLPRKDSGEAAPGLSGRALWRVTGILYPTAYLATSVAQFPADGILWPLLVGGLSVAACWFLVVGGLVLLECGGSSLPSVRVHWVGVALYLYVLLALTISLLIVLFRRAP